MASAITASGVLWDDYVAISLRPPDVVLNYSDYRRTQEGLAHRWPRAVPTYAQVEIHPGFDPLNHQVTRIHYSWVRNFGKEKMGYTDDVVGQISIDDIQSWRRAAEESERSSLDVMRPAPKPTPAEPVILPCQDCGYDTFVERGWHRTIRCFYCQELHDIRAAKPPPRRRWWQR